MDDEYMEKAIKFAPWAILSSIKETFLKMKDDKGTKTLLLSFGLALSMNSAVLPTEIAWAADEPTSVTKMVKGDVSYMEFVKGIRRKEVFNANVSTDNK